VIPEVVTLDKEGQPEAVVYESLVSLALQGIKEMWATLVDLKDKVATVLERLAGHDEEIAALKSRVTLLEAQLGAAPAAVQESVGGGAVDDGEQGSTALDTEVPAQ
jgi:predicted  nucleic acid-binding Zn-ribbon protein